MRTEITQLEAHQTWTKLARSALPENATLLTSLWALKKKRRPDGSLLKFKARLCVRGDRQVHGDSFWEVYAPVVSWPLVRMLFVLTIIRGLRSRHVDFSNAFAQSRLDEDIYLELPIGFDSDKAQLILKLNKSLYGLRQAARVWFLNISDGLRRRGFRQSTTDPCLFFGSTLIVVIYVDDMLIFGSTDAVINELVASLRTEFPLTDEGDVRAYLGVSVDRVANGSFVLRQQSSITKLLDLLQLTNRSSSATTPAVTKQTPPPANKNAQYSWSFASAVGLLLWIAYNTRPDISFASSRVAQHMSNPQPVHYAQVYRIGRYLLGTRDRGMIIHPTQTDPKFEVHVDSDFAGNYCQHAVDLDINSELARSRTAYLLFFANVPLLWVTKLQGETALSTTEAEYIALSQSLRDVSPTQTLLQEVSTALRLRISTPLIHCTVFEDNAGAIELANTPKMRPRTKHIAVKYHHFRERVARKQVTVQKISSFLQRADILTKALPAPDFIRLRKFILGW